MRSLKSFFFSILVHILLAIVLFFFLQKKIFVKPIESQTQTITFNIQHFQEPSTAARHTPVLEKSTPPLPTESPVAQPTVSRKASRAMAKPVETPPDEPSEELSQETFEAYTKALLKSMGAIAALENNATKIAAKQTKPAPIIPPKRIKKPRKKKIQKKIKQKRVVQKKLPKRSQLKKRMLAKLKQEKREEKLKKRLERKKARQEKRLERKMLAQKRKAQKKERRAKRKARQAKKAKARAIAKASKQAKANKTHRASQDSLANLMRGAGKKGPQRGSSSGHRANNASMRMITQFYGSEFNSFTSTQKQFIEKYLGNIYKITQKGLSRSGYPAEALKKRQEGIQLVTFFLHPNGTITQLRYKKRLASQSLNRNTLSIIRRYYKKYPRPKTTTKITFYVQYSFD